MERLIAWTNTKSWKVLWWMLRFAMALFFCHLLWIEWQNEGYRKWSQILERQPHAGYITLAFLLSFLNWGLEARKWQWLISPVISIPFLQALKSTVAGLVPGFFTPNRVGEFGGRLLFIPSDKRRKVVLPTLAGSFSQLLITLVPGGMACWLLSGKAGMLHGTWFWAVGFMASLFALALLILYFNLHTLWPVLQRTFSIKISNFPQQQQLLHALKFSFLRYIVFTSQYLIILAAFEIYIPYNWAFVAVPGLFFIQTAVPSVSLLELGLRGKSTLVVIGMFSQDVAGMVLSAFLLWLINLVIPALFGIPALFQFRKNET